MKWEAAGMTMDKKSNKVKSYTIYCITEGVLTTLAFFSKSVVISVDDAIQCLWMRYWYVINVSKIAYNITYEDCSYPICINITRFQLNYENAYGTLPLIFFLLITAMYYKWGGV